jgi:hypothetical protein
VGLVCWASPGSMVAGWSGPPQPRRTVHRGRPGAHPGAGAPRRRQLRITVPEAAVAIKRIQVADLGGIGVRGVLKTKIVPRMFRIMVNQVSGSDFTGSQLRSLEMAAHLRLHGHRGQVRRLLFRRGCVRPYFAARRGLHRCADGHGRWCQSRVSTNARMAQPFMRSPENDPGRVPAVRP